MGALQSGTAWSQPSGTSPAVNAVTPGATDIAGVVTGPRGPEAGMWVIAETSDLPTRFARIVVTDEQGRYLLPDLPVANYSVWVRGYGLVDSPRLTGKPGQTLNLRAIAAPDAASAAHYYPAIYWYTMMKIPPPEAFGGSTDIPKQITRGGWLRQMNNVDCIGCHQLGQASTRTIPAQLGSFASGQEAWVRRIQSGQSGHSMTLRIAGQFGGASREPGATVYRSVRDRCWDDSLALDPHRVGKNRALQLGAAQVGPAQIGALQVGAGQIGIGEIGA